jgi:transcriptional regulator with XRE-family HTH domain
MIVSKNKVGDRLVSLRGKTPQRQVAEALNISISALSMYEQGRRIPRDSIKVRIAKYYNTTIESIFYT